jgi:hypothetical protein
MYAGDNTTVVFRNAGYLVDWKSSDFGPLPIPEPGQYMLMSLGVLSVGAALRRRRGVAMAA